MDKDVINAKLETLTRCVARIKSKNVHSLEELESNFDVQDVIVLNLQRAVQTCIDIANHILLDYNNPPPFTMAESFIKLADNNIISKETAQNLSHAVGFRNIAVHQYENIDCAIIYSIINHNLEDFKIFSTFITNYLARGE